MASEAHNRAGAGQDSSKRRPPSARLRDLGSLHRVLGLVSPYKWRFALATALLLMGAGLALVYPQAARYAIDVGIESGDTGQLDLILLGFCGLVCLQGLLVWVRHYLMSWLGQRVVADLRVRVVDHLLRLPASWFQERVSGEIVGRLASDVSAIEVIVGSQLSFALRSVVQLLGGLILLFTVDAWLTVLMLTVVPAVVVGALLFGRLLRRISAEIQDLLARTSAQVQEAVGAIQTVQAFVREKAEALRYREGVGDAFERSLSLARLRATMFSTVTMAGYLAVVGILWVGARAVIAGELSSGDLVAFLLYTFMVASSLASVAGLWGALQRAAGATDRLFDILETTPDIRNPASPVQLPWCHGTFSFESVGFAYPSAPERKVLEQIDLTVRPGERVALVGPSGGGKTTMASLLLRFFDVDEGRVCFEGVDVRQLSLDDLRGQISIVPQEPVLFSGSLSENIAYGRPGATPEEILEAARDAHVDVFAKELPEGYETKVGERGVKLSGGQRQRVAIARAILKDPRVLLLDEATSSLDAESEALVQDALNRLMRGRTTLVIAHRLSTVRDADRILVLQAGRLVEQGDHGSLMTHGGVYRRLVEHQLLTGESLPA